MWAQKLKIQLLYIVSSSLGNRHLVPGDHMQKESVQRLPGWFEMGQWPEVVKQRWSQPAAPQATGGNSREQMSERESRGSKTIMRNETYCLCTHKIMWRTKMMALQVIGHMQNPDEMILNYVE